MGPLRPRFHTAHEEFENGGFPQKQHQNSIFRPYNTGWIWKRNNNRSGSQLVVEELGQGNHIIIEKSLFSKSSIFKMFSVYTKTQSRRFQIPQVWRVLSKSSVFVTVTFTKINIALSSFCAMSNAIFYFRSIAKSNSCLLSSPAWFGTRRPVTPLGPVGRPFIS